MIKFLSKKLMKSLSIVALAGLTVTADAQTLSWSPAGPIYTAGRVRNMIVDKLDATGNTLYVGSTTSGVFKSTDGGLNWAPLNDRASVRNISYMAQAIDGTIYVGTGEGFLRPSQALKAQPGTGLYKLVGNNLIQVANAATTGTVINRIACDPTNVANIAIATESGVKFSTTNGSSFLATNTLTTMGHDVEFSSNGTLYFSMGSVAGNATPPSTVWKSNGALNASSVFTDITPASALLATSNYGRIELAVAPSNPNVMYASCANKYVTKSSANLLAVFASYDATATNPTWGTVLIGSSQIDPLSNGGTIASGDYAHTIMVNPSNSDQLFMGGFYFYTFTRTGGSNSSPVGSWVQAGLPNAINSQLYLHENIHDIKIIGTKFYFITDAGIYRSIDLTTATTFPPSFQPFYKGLITGQFNSVSIDRFPGTSPTPTSAASGTSLTPFQTYIGGTGGNGLTYFNGNYPLVTNELSYESGDIYNAEYSKILSKAAFFSSGSGSLYRTGDITTGIDALVDFVLNTKTQNVQSFTNSTYSLSGTPFKLWENYGTITPPDSLVFYNDTAQAMVTIPSPTSSNKFTFTIGRPQPTALIDSIIIRTATVSIANTPSVITLTGYSALNTKTISIRMVPSYTAASTGTISAPIATITGTMAAAASNFSVILNSDNNLDQVSIGTIAPYFTTTPTSPNTGTANVPNYIRVIATVYYKYPAGATIRLIDNNISTITTTLTTKTPTAYPTSGPFANATGMMSWNTYDSVGTTVVKNPVLKLATKLSARLAVPYASNVGGNPIYSIRVSNAPLDQNTPLSFVTISQDKCRTDDANGVATTNTINILGKPTVLEWGKSGTNLYYATEAGTINCLYRISHINSLVDSTSKGYNGKQHTNVFNFNSSVIPNPRSPYRTTLLGTFPNKITSISVGSNDTSMVLTFDDASPSGTLVMASTKDVRKKDFSVTNLFENRTPAIMSTRKTYCSLMEKSDPKKTFVGTDNGIYYTADITASSPSWVSADTLSSNPANWLPKVQIFDIEQQTMEHWFCYNSGQIFVATYGRGIWTNNNFFVPTVVSVPETLASTFENNLSIFPNPTNGNVNISFTGISGESAKITLYDVNGRIVKADNLGKLNSGNVNYTFETSELASGIYIVNVSGDSGVKRVAKLIVTK